MINNTDQFKYFESNNQFIPQKSKFKIKWKTIKWLTENKTGNLIKNK
jgi:hypothetical protein